MNTEYSTKVTNINGFYHCRILRENGSKVVLEARVDNRVLIGPAFRDMFRTLDKGGGDEFTSACRKRKFKEGNMNLHVQHCWGGYESRRKIIKEVNKLV